VWGNTEGCGEVEVRSKNGDYGTKKYMKRGGGLSLAF